MVTRRSLLTGLAAYVMFGFSKGVMKVSEASAAGHQRAHVRTQDGLQLDAEFAVDHNSKTFLLAYGVRNLSSQDVYLINRLYRQVPKVEIDPNLIYTYLDQQRATIRLEKKIPDIPTDRNVLVPVSPFSTPLRAGQHFTEHVSIPLPVKEYREYDSAGESSGRVVMFHYAVFRLGYYWSVPGTKEETKSIGGVDVVLPHFPPGTKMRWGVAETQPMGIQVPGLV